MNYASIKTSPELNYLDGLQAGRTETLATVQAWMTATPFAICPMWKEYVDHMVAQLRRTPGEQT
jgi:hypothetical protein